MVDRQGTVLLTIEEGIATLTLNNPAKLNPMTDQMRRELIGALRAVDADPQVRVVVLTGAGRGFCSGADIFGLHRRLDTQEEPRPGLAAAANADVTWSFSWAISHVAKPVIAAINGPAIGLGFALALSCDLRVVAEEAQMGARFPRLGVSAEEASSFLLPRLVGLGRAMELLLSGRLITGREAFELGVVNRVVPGDRLMDAAYDLARELAQNSPLALAVIKHQVYGGLEATMEQQLHREIASTRELLQSRDHAEGLRAFMEKRQPRFQGH